MQMCIATDDGTMSHYANWEAAYKSSDPTNWELLPLTDLRDFLNDSGINLASTVNALEIGCGRALRTFVALLSIPSLNRSGFSITGFDVSAQAIAVANQISLQLKENSALEFPFRRQILSAVVANPPRRLHAQLKFVQHNVLFDTVTFDTSYDLVIDWMCFHDLAPEHRQAYAAFVCRRCSGYFVIKAFSLELSSVKELGDAVPGFQKRLISVDDVRQTFGAAFEILRTVDHPEDLNPCPAPADGIIAAKRTYLLKRR
jgi:hypothetical protein